MTNKPFCRDLYNKHNRLGIRVALDMLNQYGYETIEDGNIEHYCARDCLVSKDSKNFSIEVERKQVWRRKDNWEGYDHVRVPYRKRHSQADLYIMINEASTCLIVCRMQDVKNSQTTKYTSQLYNVEEDFFAVPIDKFDVMVLENGKWNMKTNNHKLISLL